MASPFTRLQIWQHNGLLGKLAMAGECFTRIREAPTTTPEAKALAKELWIKTQTLKNLVRKRTDQVSG